MAEFLLGNSVDDDVQTTDNITPSMRLFYSSVCRLQKELIFQDKEELNYLGKGKLSSVAISMKA